MTFNWTEAKKEFLGADKTFLDSETCGLHSVMVLFQYAVDEGPIHLYNIWKEPVWKTLELLDAITGTTVVGFNLAFDVFHIVKIQTIWRLLPRDWIPEEHIEQIALIEPMGQDGPCWKPKSACDLLLHSRKNEYQALMGRSDIRIRRVPTVLAYALAEKLEEGVKIDGIFFARSKDKEAPRWRVYDIFKHGDLDADFKDVVLKFNPAGGLKFLAEFAMGYKPKFHFDDVELDRSHSPIEFGFAPTALSVSSPEEGWAVYEHNDGKEPLLKGHAWPAKVKTHIDHWANNEPAREYATDDIVYTRELYKHFGSPEPGDDDSILACMVPVVRWHGFRIDVAAMKELREKAIDTVSKSPVSVTRPAAVRDYLAAAMDETEAMFIEDSTKKAKLESISKWVIDEDGEECTACFMSPDDNCKRCGGTGALIAGPHPAAARALELLDVKKAVKEIEIYEKLLRAEKFHASFNVIGALSSRMSGGDGLNAQGIKKTKPVRRAFGLAWGAFDYEAAKLRLWAALRLGDEAFERHWEVAKASLPEPVDYTLCGGDFDAFEVTLADAVYNDPELRQALLSGKKIHGLFGMAMFPGKTYEEILASEGSEYDMYTMAKSGVFAMIYGGNAETLHRNLGIPMDVANAAYAEWGRMFPGVERARQRIFQAFCSMRQVNGAQVVWEDPAEFCETFLGFRRYFTLENQICEYLYNLAKPQNQPKEWRDCKAKVVRRDRVQVATGAVASALYGAAFGIQQANMRAAANHEIQSPGGEITKHTQRRIWDLQPVGVHPLYVAPMNIHDELECVTHPDYVEPVAEAVRDGVEHFRPKVPLIGMTWNKAMENWAEKKGGSVTLKIRSPEIERLERERASQSAKQAA